MPSVAGLADGTFAVDDKHADFQIEIVGLKNLAATDFGL